MCSSQSDGLSNIRLVHDVFTTTEATSITSVAQAQHFPELSNHTIRQFYYEIGDCIETLGDTIFEKENEELQVNCIGLGHYRNTVQLRGTHSH